MTSTERDLPEDKLRAIIDGCANVTPGPWRVEERRSDRVRMLIQPDTGIVVSAAFPAPGRSVDWERCNAAHVARLDPATVSAMASELLRSRDALASIRAERDAAVAALKPFATYFDDGGDRDNHGNPLPDEQGVGWVYINIGDFRRAARTIAGEQKNDA